MDPLDGIFQQNYLDLDQYRLHLQLGMTSAQHQHMREEWDKVKKTLMELYLDRNMTLDQVVAEMKDRGFDATSRQYKTKLKAWSLDDKKIKGDIWMAMSVVMYSQIPPDLGMVFKVPTRRNWIRYVTADAINKQMRRSKEPTQTLAEAWERLQMRRIDTMSHEAARADFQDINLSQGVDFDRYNGGLLHMLPTSYPAELPSFRELHASSPGSQLTLGDAMQPSSTAMNRLPSIQILIDSIYPRHAGTLPTSQQRLPHVGPHNNRFDKDCQITESINDHDFVSALSMLSMNSSCDQHTRQGLHHLVGEIPILPITLPDEDKMLATRWAAYYVLQSLSAYCGRATLRNDGREAAINAFQTMLDRHNRFIFSYCHWMVAVLVSNEKIDVVLDFLSDCCNVLDGHGSYQHSSYRSHFHFTLASYKGDQCGIEQYSRSLEVNTHAIGMISGYQSPAYLINQYNLAWHKLNEKHHDEALYIMSRYLPISEQIMGPKHMVTITCLALLSRTYTEMDNISCAISSLKNALNRLDGSAKILQAYRYRLLRRFAVLQIQVNDFESAEDHLLEIMNFRILHFGITSESTWNAIVPLIELLNSQDRRADADSLFSIMEKEYDQELQRRHLKDHNEHAPWVCVKCYRPRTSLRCCMSGPSRL